MLILLYAWLYSNMQLLQIPYCRARTVLVLTPPSTCSCPISLAGDTIFMLAALATSVPIATPPTLFIPLVQTVPTKMTRVADASDVFSNKKCPPYNKYGPSLDSPYLASFLA